MRLFYLTTARHPREYASLLAKSGYAPNPSNQNFHVKLINLLRTDHEVLAFSTRPMDKTFYLYREQNEAFFYPPYLNVPLLKTFGLSISALQAAKTFKPDVIFVDVMNVSLLRFAKKIKKNLNIPVIAILTDNPINLSGTTKKYNEEVFKLARYADGYLALTSGLNRLYNPKNAPFTLLPGFLTETANIKEKSNYAFFAGALYPRYGVDKLIEAFSGPDFPLKLKVAGHGPLAKTLAENKYANIEFLGHITPEESFHLAQEAKININPRPIDEQVDLYSVPSKVIDFITSGTITISTENSEIANLVGNNIYWMNDSSANSIQTAVRDVLNNYPAWEAKATTAKAQIESELDPHKQLQSIQTLIKKVVK